MHYAFTFLINNQDSRDSFMSYKRVESFVFYFFFFHGANIFKIKFKTCNLFQLGYLPDATSH